jgi:hypothetical protein
VTFRLEYTRDQTFVHFEHAKWKRPSEFMSHCSTKWGTFLVSLRDAIERDAGKPAPKDLQIYVGERA